MKLKYVLNLQDMDLYCVGRIIIIIITIFTSDYDVRNSYWNVFLLFIYLTKYKEVFTCVCSAVPPILVYFVRNRC